MTAEEIVRALRTVPEKRLRLLELAREVAGEDGSLDMERAAFLRLELEQAIQEAEAYCDATREMVRCLTVMARS